MGRAPCCDKASVKKGPWSPEEDAKLKEFIEKYGTGGNWIALPQKAGLKRCGKSCRLRWLNYLRPNIKHGEFSDDEDRIICSLYASIGSRWSIIAAQLPGRTDNDIKNYWNTKLKKKLLAMLPSFQKKPSYFQNTTLQSPPSLLPYDDHRSDQFMTTSFYNYTPNFMNCGNSLLTATTTTTTNIVSDHYQLPNNHIEVPDLSSPPPPTLGNPLISLMTNNNISVDDNCYYPGFQGDNQNMYNSPMQEYHYPASAVKEGMLMFGGGSSATGGGHELSTTCSSSEGGSSMSQISYGNYNDHQKQHQIKQEDQVALQGFGDQSQRFMIDHNYNDQKPKGYLSTYSNPLHNDLEEVKQLIMSNKTSSSSSYLFNDDDENKTTHDLKGACYYY